MNSASNPFLVTPRSAKAVDSHQLLMALLMFALVVVLIVAVAVTASMGYGTAALIIGLVGGGTLSAALS